MPTEWALSYAAYVGAHPSSRQTALAITRVCQTGGDAYEILGRVNDLVHRAVAYDGAAWFTVDPGTLLFTGAVVDSLPAATCHPFFEHELTDDSVLRFAVLAARGQRAAALYRATGGRPQRSGLWRDVLEPYGYSDEMRAVCGSGGSHWGAVTLWRARGQPPFDPKEISFLARVAPVVGAALRTSALLGTPAQQPDAEACLVLLLDDRGTLVNATEAGLRWLDQDRADRASDRHFHVLDYLRALAARAHPARPAIARLRRPDGRWDTLRASALASGGTAVVIQSSQPDELVDMLLTAYGLTTREVEVLGLICQGLTSNEMAGRLVVSPHTVRDHVKHVLAKVGVASRGELVAKLFVDHYLEPLLRIAATPPPGR
jgi:DNA-binding CsgD family transcriptional regulator